MTEHRYLLTFERRLPIGIVGLICTALGRQCDPEPELIIEDGRLVVVQPLVALPPRDQQTGAEAPATSAPAPSPHPAVGSSLLGDGDSPAAPPVDEVPSHGDLDPEASTATPCVEAGAGAELVEPADGGSAGSTDSAWAALMCPECSAGPFDRPQGLGAHRRYSHGVKGGARAERIERAAASAPIPVPAPGAFERLADAMETGTLEETADAIAALAPVPAGPPPNPLVAPPPHQCEHCHARFVSKKALGLHRAAIHPISRTRPRHLGVVS